MKHISKKGLIMMLVLLVASSSYAAKPYRMSVGVTLGSIQALSFKTFLADNVAFQVELGGKVSVDNHGSYTVDNYTHHIIETYWLGMINPNLMYERPFADTSIASCYWLAGGGLSIGYRFENSGQFGVNGIGGAEVAFHKVPLALQADFRPGYGLHFNEYGNRNLFDWSLNLSLRFCFQ